jgi:DNA-binding GntR family transcriptional regulator
VPDDLDDLSGIPRYLQVARVIEAEIRAGQWTPGNAVPSRNQLAERFGIARGDRRARPRLARQIGLPRSRTRRRHGSHARYSLARRSLELTDSLM